MPAKYAIPSSTFWKSALVSYGHILQLHLPGSTCTILPHDSEFSFSWE